MHVARASRRNDQIAVAAEVGFGRGTADVGVGDGRSLLGCQRQSEKAYSDPQKAQRTGLLQPSPLWGVIASIGSKLLLVNEINAKKNQRDTGGPLLKLRVSEEKRLFSSPKNLVWNSVDLLRAWPIFAVARKMVAYLLAVDRQQRDFVPAEERRTAAA